MLIRLDSLLGISITEVTSSSRSILYSAHLFWETPNRLLVAAGTAFGEIMYWSWTHEPHSRPVSRIHRVFLGHEGSIFGVQISKEIPSECCQRLKRVIASCSDDRTIRIWDVSDVSTSVTVSENDDAASEILRTRHTGFSNESFDATSFNSSDCLAIGWGHTSRVWTTQFLEATPCSGSLFLISAGEDATARTWELTPCFEDKGVLPYKLVQLDSAAHHSGKNLWSSVIYKDPVGLQHVVCGGADRKITSSPLVRMTQHARHNTSGVTEYSVNDVMPLAQPPVPELDVVLPQSKPKTSSKAEFFRSYCFVDAQTLLLTTNSGKVLLSHLHHDAVSGQSGLLTDATCVANLEELSGYSVCTSGIIPGVAFVAGAKGNVYTYCKKANALTKLHCANSKVGDVLAADVQSSSDHAMVALLLTVVGQKDAQLLYVDIFGDPQVSRMVSVPISELLTGSLAMSMVHVRARGADFVFIGFRRGSIAAYSVKGSETEKSQASLLRVIDKAHSGETVTCLRWFPSSEDSPEGHLVSVGRDGRLIVHQIDLCAKSFEQVHSLALPIGPNIEGIHLHQNSLLVHGFSSKKWVLYDMTAEEEIMSVETGGAHRSWTYQPCADARGGTLVWTRAASLHTYSQFEPSHTVIRPGGHGREIKAVAISPEDSGRSMRGHLIATGAEDTDIKIFQYVDQELVCQRTLRRHTTGVQHLQWSPDGSYLFSSGGCEECKYSNIAVVIIWSRADRTQHQSTYGAYMICLGL